MEGMSGEASSFFFMFESTGDSEVDARPVELGTVAMEEDDAGSSSYDDLGSERLDSYDFEGVDEESCEDEGGEEEEGNAVAEDGGGGGFECYRKLWASSEAESKSGGDLMNEMERNKLFWEACLAS